MLCRLAFCVCIKASACTYWISDGGRKKSSVAASATCFCIIYFNYAIIIVLLLELQRPKCVLTAVKRKTFDEEARGHDAACPIRINAGINWATSNRCETRRA